MNWAAQDGLWWHGWPAFRRSPGAQTVEISPVGGYRFGGGFFERVTQQEVDLDGAPSLGLVVNVSLHDGLFVEALVTHQEAHVDRSSECVWARHGAGASSSTTTRPAVCRSSSTAAGRARFSPGSSG